MGRKVNQKDVVEVALDNGKDVTAVKLSGLYYPLVITDNKIYISSDGFKSPLLASNHGRKVKKECVSPDEIKVKEKPVVKEKTKVVSVRL